MKNYFHHQEAAKRYKKGRPAFHALVIDKIKTLYYERNKNF